MHQKDCISSSEGERRVAHTGNVSKRFFRRNGLLFCLWKNETIFWFVVCFEGKHYREKGNSKSVLQSTISIVNPYARAVKTLFETSPVAAFALAPQTV